MSAGCQDGVSLSMCACSGQGCDRNSLAGGISIDIDYLQQASCDIRSDAFLLQKLQVQRLDSKHVLTWLALATRQPPARMLLTADSRLATAGKWRLQARCIFDFCRKKTRKCVHASTSIMLFECNT